MEELIKKFKNNSEKNIKNIIGQNNYNKIVETNKLYSVLLENFLKNLNTIGIKLTCDYNLQSKNYRVVSPMKLGSVGKDLTKSFNEGHSVYKKNNATKTGVVSGFGRGFYTGTKSFFSSAAKPVYSTTIAPLSSEETLKKSLNNKQKENFKLPSMCDKILFALQEGDKSITCDNFDVYSDLKKSKNRIIYSEFSF